VSSRWRAGGPARVGAGIVAAWLVAACGSSPATPANDDASSPDAGPDAGEAAPDGGVDAPPPPPVVLTCGTPEDDWGAWVDVDGQGNPYVLGGTRGSLPGHTSAGAADVFLARFDAAGQLAWTRQWGTAGFDVPIAVFVDGDELLAIWGTATPGVRGHGPRLRRMALADGALLDDRALTTAPTAEVEAATLDPDGFTLGGHTERLGDHHSEHDPWIARFDRDGEPIAAWNPQEAWSDCWTSPITSLAWSDGLLLAGVEMSAGGRPDCDRGRVVRFTPTLQRRFFLEDDAYDGANGVLAAGGAIFTAFAEIDGGWTTTVRRRGDWEITVPGFHRFGRGDAPVGFGGDNHCCSRRLFIAEPATGALHWLALGGPSYLDVLAVEGMVVATGWHQPTGADLDVYVVTWQP
jgi:hypothetical protein